MTPTTTWQNMPLDQLADHIVASHHALLNRQLPLVSELLLAHVRRYWRQHPELFDAQRIFAEARIATEQHLIKEETAGFPLLRAHARDGSKSIAPFTNSIDGHIAEHAKITSLFGDLRKALWNYRLPDDLGAEVAHTCALLDEIDRDLGEHIHLENDVLFPMARKVA